MQLYIGGDHQGRDLKEKLKKFLQEEGVDFVDLGTFPDDNIEYQDVAREVAEKVQENDGNALGLLVFGKMGR